MQTNNNSYRVGDVIVTVWGHNMIRVDFYQVITVTAASVKIVRLNQNRTGCQFGTCTPIINSFAEEGSSTVRVKNGWVKTRFGVGSKWSGQPMEFNHMD